MCDGSGSIVSDISEVSGGGILVRDDESAFNVALNEVVLVERWFIVALAWRVCRLFVFEGVVGGACRLV